MAKNKSKLAKQIYNLHIRLVKTLNDTHIFLQLALPLLNDAKKTIKSVEVKEDVKYQVPPSKTKAATAFRNPAEVEEIYRRFLSREMFESFIISAVSQFESFMFDVMKHVISEYPMKLTKTVAGIDAGKQIPIEVILNSTTFDDIIINLINRRIEAVSYAKPKDYLEYFESITGVDVSDDAFKHYIEIKATRDLLIHNSGKINEVYLTKAGEKHRGKINERISIDAIYFDHCLSILKRMSGLIGKDTERIFPSVPT